MMDKELSITDEKNAEGLDPEGEADVPFEADKITIDSRIVPMTRLLHRLKQGTIKAPPMQRHEGIWGKTEQSRLIESLMLNIPLPLFYVAADGDENWAIVDGLQRVFVIRRYLSGEQQPLTNLEFLKDYNGVRFDELPPRYINRILDTQLNFAVISSTTPPSVQRNIFKRLNTGGTPLSAQEIRHALYYGPSAKLLSSLAESKIFKDATTNSVKDLRMGARELILRALSFILRNPSRYPKNDDMDTFLCDTMQILNILPDLSPNTIKKTFLGRSVQTNCKYVNINEIQEKFFLGVKRAFKLYDIYAFRKSTPLTYHRTPINKALFEMNVSILAEITDERFIYLLQHKKRLFKYIEWYMLHDTFKLAQNISRDSLKTSAILSRFDLFEKLLTHVQLPKRNTL